VTVSLRPQPLVQILEIRFQILTVYFLRDAIHAYRRILPLTPVGASQGVQINQGSQRMKQGIRLPARTFRYLHEFR